MRWLYLLLLLLATLWVWGGFAPPAAPATEPAPADLDKIRVTPESAGLRFRGTGWFRVYLYTPAGPIVGEGQGEVLVPYRRAGLLTYRLEAGARSKEGELRLESRAPVTPLAPKVGARAVRVGGAKNPSLVIHPLDGAANVSSQPVEVRVYYPDGRTWSRTLPVRHQLAWTYFPSGDKTGVLKVVVQSAGARAERAEVDVLPGRTVAADPAAQKPAADADGRDRWQLTLGGVRDRLGNPALDGLAVSGVGGGPLDVFVTRPANQGRLPLVFPPPSQAGNYAFEFFSEDFRSAPQPLLARPGLRVSRLPLAWEGRVLVIGPVEDARSALPDDGTPARLQLLDRQGRFLLEETVVLENGRARWQPPAFAQPTWVVVELGGRSSRLEVPAP
ncbi:MAG: hypothetical protein SFU83_05650 [Meiothermus sp.]|nr:hypothetical protein [Meiothermus sp.]